MALREAHPFSVRELASVIEVDAKDAHAILNGGKATAEEYAAALAFWGEP